MTSQKYPISTISYSRGDEAKRLAYVMAKLPGQFYQNHNFLMLPYLPPGSPSNVVHIPDLPYTSIPNHWQQLRGLKLTTPIIAPVQLITAYTQLLDKVWLEKKYAGKQKELQAQWEQVSPDFWHHLFTLFPKYQGRIDELSIILTAYGPGSTFSLAKTKGSHVTIYLRLDQSLDKLYQPILFALFRPSMESRHYTWEEIESVVDFLLLESNIAQNIPFSHPVIPTLRKNQQAQWQKDSAKFLSKLGFPKNSPWTTKNGNIYFGEQKITGLTGRQQLLLEEFLVKPNQTLTYDEIARIMWQEPENFSLWAIVKEIARMRAVLKSNNIHIPVLHAHRKVGYTLT